MIDFRPILTVIGTLLIILAASMIIPALADYVVDNHDWKAFLFSIFFTVFCGGGLILTNRSDKAANLTIKQAFVLTTFSWLALAAFASLPFLFADLNISITDAFFEAMSGLTTTGATVFTGLDTMPPGILLWRSIIQWLGGIGIIVMAMAVLPMLKIGGMQLFRTESSDKSDKVLPKAAHICGAISGVYLFLTIVCGFALWLAGMGVFDAFNHAMTTIATSGFSTRDTSIAYFDSHKIELVMIVGMIASGIPFVLYIQVLRGKPIVLWRDAQVRWYLAMIVCSVIAVTLWLILATGMPENQALREASFNVVSIITTSGFSSADYNQWGSFAIIFIFLLSVMGGCTGSTTGGIKIFRYQVLYETAKLQVYRLIQPHGVFRPIYNKKPLSEAAISSVLSFFILFAFCFTILAMLISMTGLDYISSMSAAASAMANVGPGLGDVIGPTGNYSSLTDIAKWLLAFAMLVGRLEIFTVLILFSPYFWKS